MCGIAGLWGSTETDCVAEMMELLAHRGPDAAGIHTTRQNTGILGHRRLSIMDPAGGDQPILSACRRMAVAANGEIYNYPGLREGLKRRHTFRTSCDSEAALHLYKERGLQAPRLLDGMFAVAIADGEDLLLARDPIGIKPLYYGFRGKALVFASELKAIADHAEDVREFPPGSLYHSNAGFHTYYAVPDHAPYDAPAEVHEARLRRTLEAAVAKRLMSDVTVGAFLSGGLDSSIIAALMRPHVDRLHTFSVGFEGSHDLEAARLVARHLDTVHHEYVLTAEEILEKLPEIIYYLESYDEDLVRSAVPCYFTSRLAAEHVKVILTGEGADELFAGYTYYKDFSNPAALHGELRRSVTALHNVNLQRVDRMTMAHSIEGRVPFLDVDMIEMAQMIPPELKLHDDPGGKPVEKWILRRACEDLLPRDIVWRDKEQFDEGSGCADALSSIVGDDSHGGAGCASVSNPEHRIQSSEEARYYRIFCDVFSSPTQVIENMGRWAQGRGCSA